VNDVIAPESIDKVSFRQNVLTVQEGLNAMIANGTIESIAEECTLKHYFSPKDETYGCCTYAREIKLPKGSIVIGKIHRHQHLNFITQGEVIVYTEFGEKHLKAPCTFISEVGLKRVVYAIEDTLWTTVHMTQFESEAELDKIEDEVIAPTYADLGLVSSVDAMPQLSAQGV
jgi:hypothetical protein